MGNSKNKKDDIQAATSTELPPRIVECIGSKLNMSVR